LCSDNVKLSWNWQPVARHFDKARWLHLQVGLRIIVPNTEFRCMLYNTKILTIILKYYVSYLNIIILKYYASYRNITNNTEMLLITQKHY
jgi:hypothetical protein